MRRFAKLPLSLLVSRTKDWADSMGQSHADRAVKIVVTITTDENDKVVLEAEEGDTNVLS